MTVSVLVATPHSAFGELLRLSLEESGRYSVRVVSTGLEVLAGLVNPLYRIAILDCELTDVPVKELADRLIDGVPGLKLVVIPPENDPQHPSLEGMRHHGTLSRPFYLPDLLEQIDRLAADVGSAAETVLANPETGGGIPAWLDEAALERILSITTAQAGLVVCRGRDRQHLYHGAVGPAAEDELVEIVEHYWQGDAKTDLVRFIRLKSQESDFLLYVTPVARETVVGLVYPVSTPLSRVRIQTGQVVRTLSSGQAEVKSASVERPAATPAPAPQQPAAEEPAPGAAEGAQEDLSWLLPGFEEAEGGVSAPEKPAPPESDEVQEIDLAALLGSVPPPDPERAPAAEDWMPEISMEFQRPADEPLLPWDGPEETDAAQANQPAPVKETGAPMDWVTASPAVAQIPEVHLPPAEPPPPAALPELVEPEEDEDEDTRPHVISSLTNIQQLEPVSPAYSLLNYTCVLIPRLPQHHLTGALGEKVGHWVQQLCLSYGWRLEGIAVRPEYLQWMVQVGPSIPPAHLVKGIRQHTSQYIFENFGNYRRENPSGDFWATGYLIVGGPQPPSPKLLRDYIKETRSRQGIAYPLAEGSPRLKGDVQNRLPAEGAPPSKPPG